MNDQLTIDEFMKTQQQIDRPYRNAAGELLPWEQNVSPGDPKEIMKNYIFVRQGKKYAHISVDLWPRTTYKLSKQGETALYFLIEQYIKNTEGIKGQIWWNVGCHYSSISKVLLCDVASLTAAMMEIVEANKIDEEPEWFKKGEKL